MLVRSLPMRGLLYSLLIINLCSFLGGGIFWVVGNLEKWSCPTGYRPSYFVLEGGLRSGEEHQGVTISLLCRSTPRALAEDWWSARAQSCFPDCSVI